MKLQKPDLLCKKSKNKIKQSPDQAQNDQDVNIQTVQIDSSLKLIKKLKIIQKNKQLTKLKQNNKKINQLFKLMSQLFVNRHQKIKARQKTKKQFRLKQIMQANIVKLQRQARKKHNFNCKLQNKNNTNNQQFPQICQNSKDIIIQQLQIQSQTNIYNQSQLKNFKCYICKDKYLQIHQFYHRLCFQCAQFNLQKRNQSHSLQGLTALVTGARIKIGYQIALKLLREGAFVYVTSRFFNDTLLRYQQQKDFQHFCSRLVIIQCDFTSAQQVQKMLQKIKKQVKKLDILINNAAQTIVRPKQFYLKQLKHQIMALDVPSQMKQKSLKHQKAHQLNFPSIFDQQDNKLALQFQHQNSLSTIRNNFIDHSQRDQFDQPLDLRQKNTWVQKIQEVSLKDCYNTQLINSTVPFYLIGQLKYLMIKQLNEVPSWIINVSSMQGVFNRVGKQANHPHTNMAKASLNMITRTCAKQFALNNIFMNSVDTGWVTQQNPYHIAQKLNKQPRVPLDCLDGAMRVLDPIYIGIKQKRFPFGCFLKDYKQSNW